MRFRDEFIEMQVTLDESEHILYEFATLDDVINLSNRLYNLGVTGGKLYTWDERFYLWVEEEEQIQLLKADFIAILAEYGNPSTATIYRIMEYGKELMDVNAIEQIHNYFVKNKTSANTT